MKLRSEPELLHLAAAYCSAGEHCVQEVQKKIISVGGSTEAAQRIIKRLTDEKFIDESRFCRSFVNDKFRFNHWGRIRIGYELQKKGIPAAVFSEVVDGMDEEKYVSSLSSLLKEKKRSVRGRSEQDIFQKLYRFAAGRGFEGPLIVKTLKPLFNDDVDSGDME
ncbi:MAG: RecX family transcriptional regulator [Tannerella sp.]|jgi:regulatory protein|nr:RecX family transcriptional regulator [Tannerella sp.]